MNNLYEKIVKNTPQLKSGKVYCHECGTEKTVDSAKCLATGWPKCCTFTMSLDKPALNKNGD